MESRSERDVPLLSGDHCGSVSVWVRSLEAGDAEAAQRLWERYFEKLVAQAARRIRSHNCPEGAVNAEDVAASVFESIWKGANAGRFQNVRDRDELWWLLQAMTRRKVVDHIRHATAMRRYSGQPQSPLSNHLNGREYEDLVCDEPTPEYLAILEEQYGQLLSLLRDEKLRQIAVLKVEGYSNDEIRSRIGISSATLTRKLKLVRDTWRHALDSQGADDGKS